MGVCTHWNRILEEAIFRLGQQFRTRVIALERVGPGAVGDFRKYSNVCRLAATG